MRVMGLAVVAFLVCVSLAGARAEDGLQRFESQIKPQLEFKKFTYATASTLGDTGFVLNDVVVVVPGSADEMCPAMGAVAEIDE